MSGKSPEILLNALVEPHGTLEFDQSEWGTLLRLARSSLLLARLGVSFAQAGIIDRIPVRAREQVQAVELFTDNHHRCLRWELNRIHRALQSTEVTPILLKGTAYVTADLPVGLGRCSSDVDILVPRQDLNRVEQALRGHGWEPLNSNEYDEHYFREWTHELPPLRHRERGTVLDVHHNILPPTGRLHPDAGLLIADSRPIMDGRFRILAPTDMLLHSAAHLFQDGEICGGLRDVTDLDIMLRYFGRTESRFWDQLLPRAIQLELTRPLFYALNFTIRLMKTPVPANVLAAAKRFAPYWPVKQLMDHLAVRALLPELRDGESLPRKAAQALLYMRSHWLRMPPWLLARHLTHKMLRQLTSPTEG